MSPEDAHKAAELVTLGQDRAGEQVRIFETAMTFEMGDNDHKGPWDTERKFDSDGNVMEEAPKTPQRALEEVVYHALKLACAVRAGNKKAVLEFAADVGNCAWIVADLEQALRVDLMHEGPIDYDMDEGLGIFRDKEKTDLVKAAKRVVQEIMERVNV